MGNYDTHMKRLANEMRKTHGDLTEVYFIGAGKYQSILHFSDGTYFPTKPATDRDLDILKYAFKNYSYIPPEGQIDPLPLLTFGYSGTGAQCFETFLNAFGFKMANVADMTSGTKLAKNGEILNFSDPPQTQITMKGKKGRYFPDGKADGTSMPEQEPKADNTRAPQQGSSGFLKTFFGNLFGKKTWKASNGEDVLFKRK